MLTNIFAKDIFPPYLNVTFNGVDNMPFRENQVLLSKKQISARKSRLKAAGITYTDIARLADVTWTMVWMWVNGQRTSARVQAAFDKLTDGHRAA
jgi:hypothetical protein